MSSRWKRKPGRSRQPGQPPLFQPRVVGVVQIVDADDLVAGVEQQLGDLRGDEAGTAGDEVAFHVAFLPSFRPICELPTIPAAIPQSLASSLLLRHALRIFSRPTWTFFVAFRVSTTSGACLTMKS